MKNLSRYSKSLMGGIAAAGAALGTALPDGITFGEWLGIGIAFLIGSGVVAATKNTQVVKTGTADGDVTIGSVLSDTGANIGTITANTGTAVGGVVAGTTGLVGGLLDATLGKLIPGGK